MEPVPYRGQIAREYARGRRLSAESVSVWMRSAAEYVPSTASPILDLGAGSGRFSRALADHFEVPVIAIEPAEEMRRQHRSSFAAPVHLIGGRAEAIPCRDHVFKMVWASQVIHHVIDPDACAAELRRTLQPGGRVLFRGGFHDVERVPPLHRYFPGLRRLATEGSSALTMMHAALARVGLRKLAANVVEQVSASDLRELFEQTRLRARSPLLRLTDEEFHDGLRRLREAAENDTSGLPVIEQVDLVVYG
jgi:SAM-dependent methyltransferase